MGSNDNDVLREKRKYLLQCSHILSCQQQFNINILIQTGVGEDSWESLGLQGDPTSPF